MTATTATTATSTVRQLPGGIYCPVVTFFKDTPQQELDLTLHEKHIEMLGSAGCAGVVVMGSTGEAVTLTREERKVLISTAKTAFARTALPTSPGLIIAGTVGAQSTAQAIELATDAAGAGADYILTLPPAYYAPALTDAALINFFTDVADASPIPLIVYSYPAVSGGINMDSDLVAELARHPRVVGVKHTDHEVGKMARNAGRDFGSPFTVLGGATDYLLGTLAYGGAGAISGMVNVSPRVAVAVYDNWVAGNHAKALAYASTLSCAEWALTRAGLLGVKYAVCYAHGYPGESGAARKPLPAVPEKEAAHVRSACAEVLALERELAENGRSGAATAK